MLSKEMINALNKQIEEEFFSAHIYLAMGSWCDSQGLSNCAEFMYNHYHEENEHAMKIFRYVNDNGGVAVVPALKKPAVEYSSVQEVFKTAYNHELHITSSIHDLVKMTVAENDFRTNNFLQWFVAEQQEEEITFNKILDKMKIIGGSKSSLHFIEQAILQISTDVHSN